MSARIQSLLVVTALALLGCGSTAAATTHSARPRPSATPGPPKWTETTLTDTNKLVTVSCPTTTLCVAIDYGGNVLTSTDPTGGASAWTTTNIDSSDGLNDIDCPSASLCVAVNATGNVFVSTDPTGGAATWKTARIDTTFYNTLDAVSCPSTQLCVVADTSGDMITSTNPSGGAPAWVMTANVDREPANANPDANSLEGLSCPTTTLCVASDFAGNILTSTDPAARTPTWTRVPVETASDISVVSCPSAQLCMALGHGDVWWSTNPAGGTAAWNKTVFQVPFDGLACPTSTLCVAEDVATDVLFTDRPTGPMSGWITSTAASTPNHLGGGVACASASLCVVVGEDEVITSTNP